MTSNSTSNSFRRRDSQTSYFSDSSMTSEAHSPGGSYYSDTGNKKKNELSTTDSDICVICGCNDQSELGQSELVKSPISIDFDPKKFLQSLQNIYAQSNVLTQLLAANDNISQRPKKHSNKVNKSLIDKILVKVTPAMIAYQLARVGFQAENMKVSFFFDTSTGSLKAHLFCIMWSHGVVLNDQNSVVNLEKIVCESLLRVSQIIV